MTIVIFRLSTSLTLLTLALSGASPALAQAKSEGTLPGGATSLRETYGDWAVSCTLPEGRRVCTLTQVQTDPQSKQRTLTFEVAKADAKSVSGVIALPFGFSLSQGVRVQIDDGATSPPLLFEVCLSAGCIVPFTLEGDSLAKLRTGKQIKITGVAGESGKPVTLNVALKGFAPGLARLQAFK